MSSKFVGRAHVREQVAKCKSEVVALLEARCESLKAMSSRPASPTFDGPSTPDPLAMEVFEMISLLENLSSSVYDHAEKLSLLVEGSAKNFALLSKGEEWTKTRVFKCAKDIVTMFKDKSSEDVNWENRSLSEVESFIKAKDGYTKLLVWFSLYYTDNSDWDNVGKALAQHPLFDSSGKLWPNNLRFIISEVAPHLRVPAIDLYRVFTGRLSYEEALSRGVSLMALFIIGDDESEYMLGPSIPPYELEFDLGGSIEVELPNLILEGGEVTSSSKGFSNAANQLIRRFRIQALVGQIIYPAVTNCVAKGFVYAPMTRRDTGRHFDPSATEIVKGAKGILNYNVEKVWMYELR